MEYSYQKPNKNMTICSEKNKQQCKKFIDFRYKKIYFKLFSHQNSLENKISAICQILPPKLSNPRR